MASRRARAARVVVEAPRDRYGGLFCHKSAVVVVVLVVVLVVAVVAAGIVVAAAHHQFCAHHAIDRIAEELCENAGCSGTRQSSK